MKTASAELPLEGDFLTVSALSDEERTLGASAQLERAARCCRAPDSSTHTRCGSTTAIILVSSASGPRVSGCTGFNPLVPRILDKFQVYVRLYLRGCRKDWPLDWPARRTDSGGVRADSAGASARWRACAMQIW